MFGPRERWLGRAIALGLVGDLHEARRGLAVADRHLDGVAAGDDAARLAGLVVAAPQNLPDGLGRQAVGHAQQIHGQLGLSAHGVHVAEGVGRRDLAKGIGIIHDGGKEIHRLDGCDFVADPVDAGIVAALKSDDYARVAYLRQTRQKA